MLAEMFQNFRNMFLEIYKLDPEKVHVAAALARKKAFKKKKVKLDILTVVDMLLMVEKGIRAGICRFIYRYEKADKNTSKYMIKTKRCHVFNTGM